MLQVINEDIWKYYDKGKWIVITTNGFVKNNGECVMGRGIAKQMKDKYPEFPSILGKKIRESGNNVYAFPYYRVFSFPVKHVWWEAADLALIEKSAKDLAYITTMKPMITYDLFCNKNLPIYLTKVGCGNGKLSWEQVQPILNKYLNEENFIICDKEGLTA